MGAAPLRMAVIFCCMTGVGLAQGPATSREPAGPQEGKALVPGPAAVPRPATGPEGPPATSARKAVAHPGKQQEGQTEDDLSVGAHLRKAPPPGRPVKGPTLPAVHPLGGGFSARFGPADAEISVPPRCDLACRRSLVERLQRGGYRARLSASGGEVLIQGSSSTPAGQPPAPGRGWCEDDCRKNLEQIAASVVRGGT